MAGFANLTLPKTQNFRKSETNQKKTTSAFKPFLLSFPQKKNILHSTKTPVNKNSCSPSAMTPSPIQTGWKKPWFTEVIQALQVCVQGIYFEDPVSWRFVLMGPKPLVEGVFFGSGLMIQMGETKTSIFAGLIGWCQVVFAWKTGLNQFGYRTHRIHGTVTFYLLIYIPLKNSTIHVGKYPKSSHG